MAKKKAVTKATKKRSASWYKHHLDTAFSQYIRLKDAKNEIAICVTCNASGHWKKMQNGHYVPRNHMNTRYDEQNCHVQCVGCNMFKNGNMDEYALFLVKKYGKGILTELNKRKQKIRQISIPEYEQLIEHYKTEVKKLENGNNSTD